LPLAQRLTRLRVLGHSENALNEFRGGKARLVRNHNHRPAAFLDHLFADDTLEGPISPLHEDVRAEEADELKRCIFTEDRHVVNRRECGKDGHSLTFAKDRALGTLEPPDRSVAVDPHNQHIPQTLGLCQCIDVSRVEKVKTAVSKDDAPPRTPEAGDNLRQLSGGKVFLR